ncbi:MAG: DUF1003 domain-containing protein [Thermodesulfobacteriota bacterium]
MKKNGKKSFVCPICNQQRQLNEKMHGELVRNPVADIIQLKHPEWSKDDIICLSCLNNFRTEYIENVLETQKGKLSILEQEVIKSLKDQELLSQDINAEFDQNLSFGERAADKVAEFGGSWRFIILFGTILVVWIAINSIVLLQKPFDPYPFILLNLVLSCLAAIQAPIIMMSQNRQETKDRLRGESDYRVNLKAELEIRHLHAKMDQLLTHQWTRLLEIQQIQMELMEEFVNKSQNK